MSDKEAHEDAEEFDRFAGKILNTLILKEPSNSMDMNYTKLINKALEVTKTYSEARTLFLKTENKKK